MRAVMIMGSKSDMDHAEKIAASLMEWGIKSELIVASAHKVPRKVADIIDENNRGDEPIVYVTIAGRSNALSGVVAANALHPVLACPPFKDKDDFAVNINSTLMMPSETPVLAVVDAGNCALAVVRILGLVDTDLKNKISDRILEVQRNFE